MQDICEEVIRRLEGARARVDVEVRFKGVSTNIYDNDFFFHNVALAFVPSHLSESFNIVFNGVEFAAHPDVLRSVADSVGEEIRAAANSHGLHNAFMETELVARSGDIVLLRTATGHNMRNTGEAVLADMKRVRALAENAILPARVGN